MNLLSLGAWDWVVETIHGLFLIICNLLYTLVVWLYEVFEAVAKVNLFSEEVFDALTGRIYVVVGIMMLFIFAYNLVLMIINPDDKKTTGNTTKVVKETIISLVLVILLPTIFNYMYIFQNHILESNIIGQIILGSVGSTSNNSTNCSEGDYDCSCDFSGYGLDEYTEDDDLFFDDTLDVESALVYMCENYKNLSASKRGAYSIAPVLMSAFYKPTNFTFDDCVDYLQGDTNKITNEEEQKICVNYFYDVTASKYTGEISPFVLDGYLRGIVSDSDENSLEFNFIMAVIAGVIAIIMFFCYAMEVGVRVAKLGLLQMISPITVMMRIIPKQKEKIYDKWFSMLMNTYLDVFMRLVIIYFALFSISLVPDVIDALFASFESSDAGFFVKALALVFVILGILRFAQEAPSLIKEFFGSSGKFALKGLKENKFGGAALGMVGGGLTSAVGNMFNAGRNIKNANGAGGKFLAGVKSPFSVASGALGGAARGAKKGYGATGIGDLKDRIAEAKYGTDAAYERGVFGGLKHRAKKIGKGFTDFGGFISGSGATNFKLQATELSLKDVQNVNSNFKNHAVELIESAFDKMNNDYRNEKDVKFGGVEYSKVGDKWVKKDDPSDTSYHKNDVDMGKAIKDHFDALKKAEYVKQYSDNHAAFENLTNKMISTLNENFPKIGNDIVEGINKKLDGTGISFNNTDEITEKIGDILREINTTSDEALKNSLRGQLYDINDALEGNLKAVKKEVIVAQQEKKDK